MSCFVYVGDHVFFVYGHAMLETVGLAMFEAWLLWGTEE